MSDPEARRTAGRRTAAAVGLVAVAAPFLAVEIVPITDLPQQVSQVRLLLEILGGGGDGTYAVQWWHPNKLGLLPFLPSWPFGDAFTTGALGMAAIALAWAGSVHWLARCRDRDPAAALVASALVFHHVLYWGFPGFLLGFGVFALWLAEVLPRDGEVRPVRRRLLPLALALYCAHVLWLAVGTAVVAIVRLRDRAHLAATAACLAPAWILVSVWYPHLVATGFSSDVHWGGAPWERLTPGWVVESVLGGLASPVEPAFVVALTLWLVMAFAVRSGRRDLRSDHGPAAVDRPLLAVGGGLFTLALCLPGVAQHTILFAARWVPPAVALMLLAAPRPGIPGPRPRLATAAGLLILLAATTLRTWQTFEREELDGLRDAIEGVRPGDRVLGLDLFRTSERLDGYPFYHQYAWAAAERGAEPATSFAGLTTSLVVFRTLPHEVPWTPGLDWRARKLRASDLRWFDAVIAHADARGQELFEGDPQLEPEGPSRRWRLYRVLPARIDPEPAADTGHGSARPPENRAEERTVRGR